ncbi:hypothetical protein [Flavobacterium frigidarium]|uniref:hypothetical protein n=1 Tax=Flavobacterium frigidarium TaxID=99286 RepID=UPI0004081BB9|nr:hypothetical protein [Flavobacterium frigidarium]
MKKLIIALLLFSVVACKNKEVEKDSEPGLMESVQKVNKLNKAADSLKEYEKQIEKLKAMKPVSNEVFKEILIEEIGGLKRSSYNAGTASMVGLSSAEAKYDGPNSENIKISILDGAGESGSALIALTHMTIAMDIESIEGTKTKKTEIFDGIRYLTENDSSPDSHTSATMTFIYNNRFQISLEATKMSLEDLKVFAKNLDLSKLH